MSLLTARFMQNCLIHTITNGKLLPLYYCTKNNVDSTAIESMVKNNKVVVFMKGNPEAPRCGFSNAVVQIMRMHGVNYDSHDVLENEEIRKGIF